MVFDTSFHPVHGELIAHRILPWILGHTPLDALDDLAAEAVRLAGVGLIANAWGLGATQARCDAFDPSLHVWGRPFLVTGDSIEGRAAAIDAWLACSPEDAEALARRALNDLEPGLADRVRPADDGALPPAHVLRGMILGPLVTLRGAAQATLNGLSTVEHEGQALDAQDLLAQELSRAVLAFAAVFRPGWMSAGPTWPTHVLHTHPVRDAFLPDLVLIRPVVEALPDVPWPVGDTLDEPFGVGGCLPFEEVPRVLAALDPTDDVERVKLREALQDAHHRGLPFAEAAGIYSGSAGILN